MLMILFCFTFIALHVGFLMDKNTLTGGQLDQMRRDNENTLSILTSQLQQRFDAIEKGLQDQKQENKSISDLENAYRETTENYTKLNETFQKLQSRYELQQSALMTSNSQIVDLQHKVENLELKTINQLQDLQTMQQNVQKLEVVVNKMSNHEVARSQDFLSLYNITTHQLDELNKQTANQIKESQELNSTFSHKFLSLADLYNTTRSMIENLTAKTEDKEQACDRKQNETELTIKQNYINVMQKIDSKVALQACANQYNAQSYSVIIFPSVLSSRGISNIPSFTSTGKFVCREAGDYYISTIILSNTVGAYFRIMKNSLILSRTWYSPTSDRSRSATGFAAAELNVNDTLWIQTGTTMAIYGGHSSCVTIFKL